MSSKRRRIKQRLIQEERLKSFIQDEDQYEERQVGNEWWVKNFNGGTGLWQVAIYSNESFKRYKQYTQQYADHRNAFANAISKD